MWYAISTNCTNTTLISFYYIKASLQPSPVAARSKGVGLWPLACWECGFEFRRGHGCVSVCCVCCVLSGSGHCIGPITRPEKSYRVWFVWVWSWILDNEEAFAHWGLLRHIKKMSLQTSAFKDETTSMEKRSSSEDTDQEIPRISFPCLQVPATVTIMGQMNPIHDLASYF
jgi:hypothetical protein